MAPSLVDLLPPEVTRQLAGLQNEVPPGPFAAIAAEVTAEDATDSLRGRTVPVSSR